MSNSNVDVQIALVKQQIDSQQATIEKLDAAISTMTGILASLKELIAVHEQRLDNQDKVIQVLFEGADQRRTETISDITKIKSDIEEDLANKIEPLQNSINTLNRWMWTLVGAGSLFLLIVKFTTF